MRSKDCIEWEQELGQELAQVAKFSLTKRYLDLACIILTLPVLIPLAILIGLGIKSVSPGSILFRQERVGYRGRRFTCLKFRTMRVGADSAVHRDHLAALIGSERPLQKLDSTGDPRLIPFGSILRQTGLDELPQVINVLRGEMSLVGPRPCTTYEYENFLPWQRKRFLALPGLTGLWQVSGKNKTTFGQMINLDISYAENRSLWLDLKILIRTVPAVIEQVIDKRKKSEGKHK